MMRGRWCKGNAGTDGADRRGWLVGHFIEDTDDIRASKDVQIKWGVHRVGEQRAAEVTDEYRTTVILLIRGRFRLDLSKRACSWRTKATT
jgi:hypothetical protein